MPTPFHPDYNDFRFEAVVDWIEVRITLDQPTQPRHVRRRIARALKWRAALPFVHAHTTCASRTSRVITLRFHDPDGPAAFMRDVQHIRPTGHRLLVESDIEVVGLEVALDVYHRKNDRHSLVAMGLHMYRHRASWPQADQLVTEPGHFHMVGRPAQVREALAEGLTINSRRHPEQSHATRHYIKTTDTTMTGAYEPLPVTEHRSRMESTLSGADLPFTTIQSWREFKFQTLAKRFTMRRLAPGRKPESALLMNELVRLGTARDPAKVAAHARLSRPGTTADLDWYERARLALRRLTRRQQRPAEIRTPDISSGTAAAQVAGIDVEAGPEYLKRSLPRPRHSVVRVRSAGAASIRPCPTGRRTTRPGDDQHAGAKRASTRAAFWGLRCTGPPKERSPQLNPGRYALRHDVRRVQAVGSHPGDDERGGCPGLPPVA